MTTAFPICLTKLDKSHAGRSLVHTKIIGWFLDYINDTFTLEFRCCGAGKEDLIVSMFSSTMTGYEIYNSYIPHFENPEEAPTFMLHCNFYEKPVAFSTFIWIWEKIHPYLRDTKAESDYKIFSSIK